MRNAKRTLILLAVVGSCLLASPAAARAGAACSVKEAQRTVHRLERRLAEAKHVLSATRRFQAAHGDQVGRWTRLARRVGWPWPQLPTLMYVIDRESGGAARAQNPSSSAAGLLQLMALHWQGRGDPYDPRFNLSYGLKLYRGSGWAPWSL